MRQLRDILRVASRPGDYVLGTVVDVRGSSYRKPGARVLIGSDGSRVGLISGGCLEKDVVRHAFAWTDDGPNVVLYDTRGDVLNPQGDYGTGCDGMVWLLLERWPTRSGANDPLRCIETVWETGEPDVLATVYAGPEALVGQRISLVAGGGTELFERLRTYMSDALEWSRPRSVQLNVDDCSVSVLVEPLRPPPELVVFGAGDDVQPLVRIASAMGWTVRVADRWPALVTRARFPEADELVCQPIEKLAEKLQPGRDAHVVLMTHNLTDDATLLPAMLQSEAAWIGLLGPRRRTARVVQMLADRGQLPGAEELDRLQTPVGLDLGGDTPEEVAMSIVSAIAAHRNGRTGGLLSETDGSIHPAHETIVEEVE